MQRLRGADPPAEVLVAGIHRGAQPPFDEGPAHLVGPGRGGPVDREQPHLPAAQLAGAATSPILAEPSPRRQLEASLFIELQHLEAQNHDDREATSEYTRASLRGGRRAQSSPLILFAVLGSGCFQPAAESQVEALPLAAWCADRSLDRQCRSQVACRIAAPDAGCADVSANARSVFESDPCPPSLFAFLDAGTVRYDGRAAARCLVSQRSACGELGTGRLACDAVLVGEGAVGAPCALDVQCAPDLWCDFTAGTCPGACRPRVAVGEVATNAAACASSFAERLDGGAYRCLDAARLGEACGAGLPCAGGLSCDQGRCASSLADGAACTDSQQCQPGATCAAGRCTPFAARGAPCASQFVPVTPEANRCQLGLACRGGVCGEPLREGESCLEEPNRCTAGTRCDPGSQRCVPQGGAGAPCSNNIDCVTSLWCVEGACRAPAKLGEPCDAQVRCEAIASCVEGRCVSSARECR